MTLYAKVINGEITEVSRDLPIDGVGNNGWCNAIEIRPALIPGKQNYSNRTFDLSKDPIEIIYEVHDYTIDERKFCLKTRAMQDVLRMKMEPVINQSNPRIYTKEEMDAAKALADIEMAKIDTAITHEDLDAFN